MYVKMCILVCCSMDNIENSSTTPDLLPSASVTAGTVSPQHVFNQQLSHHLPAAYQPLTSSHSNQAQHGMELVSSSDVDASVTSCGGSNGSVKDQGVETAAQIYWSQNGTVKMNDSLQQGVALLTDIRGREANLTSDDDSYTPVTETVTEEEHSNLDSSMDSSIESLEEIPTSDPLSNDDSGEDIQNDEEVAVTETVEFLLSQTEVYCSKKEKQANAYEAINNNLTPLVQDSVMETDNNQMSHTSSVTDLSVEKPFTLKEKDLFANEANTNSLSVSTTCTSYAAKSSLNSIEECSREIIKDVNTTRADRVISQEQLTSGPLESYDLKGKDAECEMESSAENLACELDIDSNRGNEEEPGIDLSCADGYKNDKEGNFSPINLSLPKSGTFLSF